jgi:beta-glucosidase
MAAPIPPCLVPARDAVQIRRPASVNHAVERTAFRGGYASIPGMTTADDTASNSPISPARLDELVRSLSIEEKAALTAGTDSWHASGAPTLGLAPMHTSDGPNGVRGMTFPPGSSATCTPCGTAFGATWDVDLVAELAGLIGAEAKRGGVAYMLGPVLNLIRSPLGGRDFECYSEDPVLSARLGVAYVTGMQAEGVAATPKHFVANDSETHRTTVDCVVDERTLREVYLLPFEAAAKAGAWSMMSAYNHVNGVYCSDDLSLARDIMRGEWAWDGVLMSDWFATHETVAGALAGLDLEMPGPSRVFGAALAEAVRSGALDESVLDEQARRILRLAARVGALPATNGHGEPANFDPSDQCLLSTPEAAAVVRRAAAESFVLLSNDGILPLSRGDLRCVAVIGPNAANPCIQGGGAAHIRLPYAVTPLEGLRAALPAEVEIAHEPGGRTERFLPALSLLDVHDLSGESGISVDFFRGQEPVGEPAARWHTVSTELHLFGDLPEGLPQNDFSVRMSAWLTAERGGSYAIAMRGLGGRRLLVDGALVADKWDAPAGVDTATALFEGKEHGGTFELEAGQRVLIQAEMHSVAHAPSLLAIGCRPPEDLDPIGRAVAAAASADLAIVVVGTDDTWDTEGRDRSSVMLPGLQNELVERVAAANPRTVVVVNAGCQVALPWADKVAAVLYAWLPGQEFGNALADVLLGVAEPGGRMPVTIAHEPGDYPALNTTPDAHDQLVYTEGINVGYRHFDAASIEPQYSFGHGLGYTEFEYESLRAIDGTPPGEPLELRLRLRNIGKRAGKEVVQVYVADLESSVPRPPRELKGFAVVRLAPGESKEIGIPIARRDLAFWDVERHDWRVEPGRFEIQVGHSSGDIRLRAEFEQD